MQKMNVIIETYPQKQYKDWLFKAVFGEGREEKTIEDATELLKGNVSPEIISKFVKLPLEQVLELQKQINRNDC